MTDFRDAAARARCLNQPHLLEQTRAFQDMLENNRIAWHNTFADECCSSFCCCADVPEFRENGFIKRLPAGNNLILLPHDRDEPRWNPLHTRISLLNFIDYMIGNDLMRRFTTREQNLAGSLRRICDMLEGLLMSEGHDKKPFVWPYIGHQRPDFTMRKWFILN